MSFETVWGFNPDNRDPGNSSAENPKSADCGYNATEEQEAAIPLGVWAQIYELERMLKR